MADINNSLGKRKSLCSQIIFELEDDHEQPPGSPNSLDNEPVSKVTKKEEITETSDSNLYQELSQTSVETNISILEKLTELQDENMKLKRQLEEMNNKLCKCTLNLSGRDETDNKESLITVKFHDKSIADEYREKFLLFLRSFIEFTCTEDNLNITIGKNNNKKNDLIDDLSPSKKRKRKKSKSKSKDLFVVDTTPSVQKSESMLKYVSKYSVTVEEEENQEKESVKCPPASICFNCDQNHSLKDCPEPKNYVKISAARNKMKQQQINKTRYHVDEEHKFAHLRPGEISAELQKALGISSNELPPYIYRMRVCGYPPGWMEDARVTHSNISLFGMDGKELTNKNNGTSFELEKVVEYPGFNMPMDKGVKDDFQYYDCPPYSEKYSKAMMLEYISKMVNKEQDNLETCDMELDQSSDETVQPPGCETSARTNRLSPSLIDLEQKKMELLAELGDNTTNTSTIDDKSDCIILDGETQVKICEENSPHDIISLSDSSFVVIDDSENIKSNDELNDDCANKNDGVSNGCDSNIVEATTPKADIVTKSTYGTPIVKSGSAYNKLPDPENFSRDISPVINFENLPNATGKYDQMNNILQKVRRTLKNNYNL